MFVVSSCCAVHRSSAGHAVRLAGWAVDFPAEIQPGYSNLTERQGNYAGNTWTWTKVRVCFHRIVGGNSFDFTAA
jgi:hypothetical protein